MKLSFCFLALLCLLQLCTARYISAPRQYSKARPRSQLYNKHPRRQIRDPRPPNFQKTLHKLNYALMQDDKIKASRVLDQFKDRIESIEVDKSELWKDYELLLNYVAFSDHRLPEQIRKEMGDRLAKE